MKYPGIGNSTLVAVNEAEHLEPFKGILERHKVDLDNVDLDNPPHVENDDELDTLNAAIELAENVGQVYDHALRIISSAASELCDAVERYVAPKPGDKHCLRSELLNTKERLRKALEQ